VDAREEQGGVPSRLIKTDAGVGRQEGTPCQMFAGPVGEEIEGRVTLDALAREGARRTIAAALEAEVDQYVGAFVEEVDEEGKRLVVRNGRARERKVTVGSGTLPLRAPRVNDKRIDETGERKRFSSQILPKYARRSLKLTEVLPVLYLHRGEGLGPSPARHTTAPRSCGDQSPSRAPARAVAHASRLDSHASRHRTTWTGAACRA
jgi:hypothetical protein